MSSPKKMDKVVTALQTSMDTTVDRLNTEVHGYIRRRTVSRTAWLGVLLLSAANFMSMVTFSTPGWGWTREIAGVIQVAGKYHGLYGVWYVCWTDIDEGYLGMCDLWTAIDYNSRPGILVGLYTCSN